jgi:glycosyltransferase involved in cell wall biosynthesis
MMDIVIWPKISVVTPSFNQATFIEETINSVLDQGYPNLEYIIIDGGSTDGSKEIIQKYENQLVFWTSEPDNGQYHAINKGFSHSNGEIMLWLNSDDKLLPGALFTIAEVFSAFSEIQWLTSSLPVIWNKHGQVVDCTKRSGFNRESFFRGVNLPGGSWYARSWIQQESTCWRRSLWDTSGGTLNDNLNFAGDFELWLRFFQQADLYSIQSMIGGFRKHGDQKTGFGMEKYREEALSCLQAQGKHPYGRVQSSIRKLFFYTVFNNPHSINQLPSIIIKLLEKYHVIYPTNMVIWNGENWEIKTNYTI